MDLMQLLATELASDIRSAGRAHERYLQVMDRAFLSRYLQDTDETSSQVADLNTASHAPGPQPWGGASSVTGGQTAGVAH